MPLCYEGNTKVWMATASFTEWFKKMDKEMKTKNLALYELVYYPFSRH